jgi:hypothetical protein
MQHVGLVVCTKFGSSVEHEWCVTVVWFTERSRTLHVSSCNPFNSPIQTYPPEPSIHEAPHRPPNGGPQGNHTWLPTPRKHECAQGRALDRNRQSTTQQWPEGQPHVASNAKEAWVRTRQSLGSQSLATNPSITWQIAWLLAWLLPWLVACPWTRGWP